MSNEKRAPGWLGSIGDDILPSFIDFIGIIINQYKDPYQPTSICFFLLAQIFFHFHPKPFRFHSIQFDLHIFFPMGGSTTQPPTSLLNFFGITYQHLPRGAK